MRGRIYAHCVLLRLFCGKASLVRECGTDFFLILFISLRWLSDDEIVWGWASKRHVQKNCPKGHKKNSDDEVYSEGMVVMSDRKCFPSPFKLCKKGFSSDWRIITVQFYQTELSFIRCMNHHGTFEGGVFEDGHAAASKRSKIFVFDVKGTCKENLNYQFIAVSATDSFAISPEAGFLTVGRHTKFDTKHVSLLRALFE